MTPMTFIPLPLTDYYTVYTIVCQYIFCCVCYFKKTKGKWCHHPKTCTHHCVAQAQPSIDYLASDTFAYIYTADNQASTFRKCFKDHKTTPIYHTPIINNRTPDHTHFYCTSNVVIIHSEGYLNLTS